MGSQNHSSARMEQFRKRLSIKTKLSTEDGSAVVTKAKQELIWSKRGGTHFEKKDKSR
jgi:hypothetical protein